MGNLQKGGMVGLIHAYDAVNDVHMYRLDLRIGGNFCSVSFEDNGEPKWPDLACGLRSLAEQCDKLAETSK
jgi:hypothetical protein